MAKYEIAQGKIYNNGYAQLIINKTNPDNTVSITIQNKNGTNQMHNFTPTETEALLIAGGF